MKQAMTLYVINRSDLLLCETEADPYVRTCMQQYSRLRVGSELESGDKDDATPCRTEDMAGDIIRFLSKPA